MQHPVQLLADPRTIDAKAAATNCVEGGVLSASKGVRATSGELACGRHVKRLSLKHSLACVTESAHRCVTERTGARTC